MSSSRLKLKNGIRVHLVPFAGTQAVTLLVLCKFGSRYETAETNGAAHFIEHLMFKGTKRRPTTLHISRELDAVGAEYNAFTGKDMTGYYVTIDARHLRLAVDVLSDMLFHSKFDVNEMDRERGVIIEEINMYHDNPSMHVEDLLEAALFEGNALGWEIAGSHMTMRAMTRESVLELRHRCYVPSRLVVAVAGRVDERAKEWLNGVFGCAREPAGSPPEFCRLPEPTRSLRLRVKIQNKKTKQVQLALGFPSYPVDDKRLPALGLLSVILGGNMSSRLFVAVRERRGLAYFIRSSNSSYEDTGNFSITAGLDQSRLPLAMRTILSEIRRIKKKGVTARELSEAKEYFRGKLLLRLEESSNQADWYARQELFLKEVKTPEQRMNEIGAVSRAQVQQAANEVLDEKRMCAAGIGPFASEKVFLHEFGL